MTTSIEAAFSMFTTYLKAERGLASNTLESYGRDISGFMAMLQSEGKENVEDIGEDEIRQFLSSKIDDEEVKTRTVARYLVSIRQWMKFLVGDGIIETDPSEHIDMPKYLQNDPVYLTEREVDALLNAPDESTPEGLRDRAMIELLYATGLRVSELVGLGVRDVDLDSGCITAHGKGGKDPAFSEDGGKEMKLNYKRTLLVGFAFLSICAFWQMYDSIVPLILTKTFHMNETFSGAIMAVAMGALFAQGKGIERILDMAATLEPLVGRFAVAFFMVGTLAAGLSSVFPILMVAPLLVGDWRDGKMETKTPLFRIVCLVAAAWGLVVPALGGDPVAVTIAAQVSNVFVLPLTVAAAICLVNCKAAMGAHRAGLGLNALLAAAFAFSVAVALTGVKALAGLALN